MGPRLFVFGGFDPLAAGRAAARARALLLRACAAGREPRCGVVTTAEVEPATVSAWAERLRRSGFSFVAVPLVDVGAVVEAGGLDLLHVPAGHTAHLLHHLRPHAERLRSAWQAGLRLSGQSGGGLCFGARLWSASRFGAPEWVAGLGLVPLGLCAHFDQRRWANPQLPVPAAAELDVLGLDEEALLDWSPAGPTIVALRPGARGFRLSSAAPPAPLPARDLSPLFAWLIRARRTLGRTARRRL